MPLVRIEILKGRRTAERKQLLQAVHAALVEAFDIPEDDRTQRLIEHDPENFEIPPGGSENYALVEITAFPGRSQTAKRALYYKALGCRDPPREPCPTGETAEDLDLVHPPPIYRTVASRTPPWRRTHHLPRGLVEPLFRSCLARLPANRLLKNRS